jgi:hypothetical protein
VWWLGGMVGCSSPSGSGSEELLSTTRRVVAAEPALAQAPGAYPLGAGPTVVQFGSIVPVVTETGFVSMSIDGIGMVDATGVVQIDKPAGASVRRAFLAAASTGSSGRQLADGDVSVDGAPVSWLITTQSSIGSWNHWAEVTDLVAPQIDAAAPGPVELTIGELGPASIEGEILAVIFDEPSRRDVSTVALLFGAQQVQGDTFHVRLSDPLDLANPDLSMELSLGISFGYLEGASNRQFSIVDVNGQRLTSSAGGQEDGIAANGALLTVGGVGDSIENPPPDETPPEGADNTRFDDELYDLRPFAQTGDTELTVFTQNPSNDDNIFFSALFISGAAVIGEGIVLGPISGRAPLGTSHGLTAIVQDAFGRPVVDRAVTFNILAGPNEGETALVPTDASGDADFEYVGDSGAGVDEIQASFVDSRGITQFSNVALEEWFVVQRAPIAECRDVSRAVGADCSVDVLPADVGQGSLDPDGDPLAFVLDPSGPFALGPTPVTLVVSDNSGLSASCISVVTAVDETAPTLTLPGSISVGCAPPAGAPVSFEAAASDNCGPPLLTCVDADGQTVASGATFPIGSTTVTCEASDASDNVASQSFAVTVTADPAAPSIQCNTPELVSGEATITATATDACSGPVTVEVTDYTCWREDHRGRRVENDACSVQTSGADLIITDTGCATGFIEWTVRAVDARGDVTTQECQVRVEGRERHRPRRQHHGHQSHHEHRR